MPRIARPGKGSVIRRRSYPAEGAYLPFIPGHTPGMKTAVSIPDAVFQAAERLAERRRCSRSRLYTQALELLLADADEVTNRLDTVYGQEPSELSPALRAAQHRALNESW